MLDQIGLNVPKVDAEKVLPLYNALYKAIQDGLVASCHAVGRGGIGVHLALSAMGGNSGMNIDLRYIPAEKTLSNTRMLYSESAGRFIVTIDPKKRKAFEDIMDGLDSACIGRVMDVGTLQVLGIDGEIIINERIGDLKDAWKEPFGGLV